MIKIKLFSFMLFSPCIDEEPPRRKELVDVKPKVPGIGMHKELASEELHIKAQRQSILKSAAQLSLGGLLDCFRLGH